MAQQTESGLEFKKEWNGRGEWERGVGGGALREKVLGFVWTDWLLYRIGRIGYLKKFINYIIYF